MTRTCRYVRVWAGVVMPRWCPGVWGRVELLIVFHVCLHSVRLSIGRVGHPMAMAMVVEQKGYKGLPDGSGCGDVIHRVRVSLLHYCHRLLYLHRPSVQGKQSGTSSDSLQSMTTPSTPIAW